VFGEGVVGVGVAEARRCSRNEWCGFNDQIDQVLISSLLSVREGEEDECKVVAVYER